MNRQILYLLSSVTLLLFIVGCDEDQPEPSDLTVIVTELSACKSFEKDGSMVSADSTSCVEFSYSESQQMLSLTHINTGFNCCPGEPYCEISLSNDTIIITEFEENSDCDCNCLYDMSIAVNRLEKDNYIVKFIEPYRGSQQEIIFEIDLMQDSTGSYCVERTEYPWGN
jgi:hypothetical protein